ncbi:MAG: hypothetical protein INR65_08595 [Gluconacetobacter diazotrophicus]|nr:hypothetical protein [Gluconacetobacter diazotrophicus]
MPRTLPRRSASFPTLAPILLLGTLSLGACAGLGEPAPAAGAGSLARHPLAAMQETPTSVGPAGTGPAGQAADVGDGTAALGY